MFPSSHYDTGELISMKPHDPSHQLITPHQPTDQGYFALQDTVVSQVQQQDRGNQYISFISQL